MIIEKTFPVKGFRVEIRATLDVTDTESHCYLECGKFSATLECADSMGGFESDDGTLHIIPMETLKEIRDWAEENEY
jgi:hypothetical protein